MSKIWLKELHSGREYEADPELRCVRAAKDFDPKGKGVTIARDDGAVVHLQHEAKKWKSDTLELSDARVGERVFARAGSANLGGVFWPLFEVLGADYKQK